MRVRVKLGSRVRGLPLAGSFANHLWQALVGPHNRGGEVPTRDFHLRVELPVLLTTADIHAELTHVELTSMHRSGARAPWSILSGAPCRMLDIDFREFFFYEVG
jgi:hypothetical protein